jgi:hypothetical protein
VITGRSVRATPSGADSWRRAPPRASRIAAADRRDLMAISLAVAPPEER